MRVTSSDTYTVHEMRASTGTTVREYVSASGKVFGVAWEGPTLPDLRQVLGVYFTSPWRPLRRLGRNESATGRFESKSPRSWWNKAGILGLS